MQINKYNRISEPIEIIYFDGTEECAKEIVELVGKKSSYKVQLGVIVIDLEGELYHSDRVIPGDYIKKQTYSHDEDKDYYYSVIDINDYKLVE